MRVSAPAVAGETELDRLVERSRLIGSDPALVVHGGGNTSTKTVERDHRDREQRVLRIKGTGVNLATADASGFPGLLLDDVQALRSRSQMSDEELVDYLARCLVDPGSRRPSIETPLHAFLPATHVDHVHADAICALTNHPDGDRAVQEALGSDVAVVPYVRPGFELALLVAEHTNARAVVLRHHGLVTWGETHEESLGLTLELVQRAESYLEGRRRAPRQLSKSDLHADELERLLVGLRGRLAGAGRCVLHVDRSQRALADRADVVEIATGGRATPDHLLRIGRETLVVDPEGLPELREQLTARVALVPGLGCVAAGGDARAARVNAEIAAHSHLVAATVRDAFGSTAWLTEQEVDDFEQWPLEQYKLSLAPPPRELEGRIVVVTGAASGIGRAIALDLCARGAHVVCGDVDEGGLQETVEGMPEEQALAVPTDVTREDDVDELVRSAVSTFGGIDAVVSNAGIAEVGRLEELSTEAWNRSMAVNATAHFLLTRRVWNVLAAQGLGGSLVYVASKNAFAPGAGFGAYSAAKAAEVQVARLAALEGGAIGVRANAVNPDAVFDGTHLWSAKLRRQRAAEHGVAEDELEAFYARRNLLGHRVSTRDVAETVAFLASDRSAAITGAVIPVDGGVPTAFPR